MPVHLSVSPRFIKTEPCAGEEPPVLDSFSVVLAPSLQSIEEVGGRGGHICHSLGLQ